MTKKVAKLQRACLRNPVKVEVSSKYSTVDTLRQEFYFVPADYKDCYLVHVLNEMPGSMIMIFVRTCESTKLLALTLRNLGFKAPSISGQMSQDFFNLETKDKRLGALNKFKAKYFNLLICTDVASRGLDIQGVDVVINYDIPLNSKDYVHRVGRTARAGQSGYAVSLVNQFEVNWFKMIEQLLGKDFDPQKIDADEIMILREHISNSRRIALTKLKEDGGHKKRRRAEDDDEEAEDQAPKEEEGGGGSKGSQKIEFFQEINKAVIPRVQIIWNLLPDDELESIYTAAPFEGYYQNYLCSSFDASAVYV